MSRVWQTLKETSLNGDIIAMIRFGCFSLAICLAAIGCSGKVAMMTEDVPVKGKVSLANGSTVGDVYLQLQPLETGHAKKFKLAQDGTFNGETIPGKYAYYIVPVNDEEAANDPNYQAIPEAFRDSDINRTVVVAAGQDLNITLN